MERIYPVEPLLTQLPCQELEPLESLMLSFPVEHYHVVDQGILGDELCKRWGTEHRDARGGSALLEHLDNGARKEDVT
jgi:hypothetical protein